MAYRIGKKGSIYKVKKRGKSKRKTYKTKASARRAKKKRGR